MRKYIVYALIIISVLTALVWAVSQFVQPILPPNINSGLVLFFAALLSVIGVIAGFKDIIELLNLLIERSYPAEQRVVRNAIRELDSANPEVRQAAVETLKNTQHPSALKALISATRHPVTDVRRDAAKALHSFREQQIFKAFEAATADSDSEVRALAVEGLQWSDLPSSFDIVLYALNDHSAKVVIAALETLLVNRYYNSDPRLIVPLLRFWGQAAYNVLSYYNRRVKYLREKSAQTLADFGEIAIQPILEVVEESKKAAIEEKLIIHMVACSALASISSECASEAYLYFIDESNYEDYIEYTILRGKAALALAELADHRAIPALIKARRDYWTDTGPIPYVLSPSDGVYRDPYTKALKKMGYPYKEDPHERDPIEFEETGFSEADGEHD